MQPSTVAIYAGMADKRERDPISEDQGRATVPMGLGFKWRRFHKGEGTVWVENIDGRMIELTRTQASVLDIVRSSSDSGPITMTSIARALSVHTSTISRAMVKLASFGLIAYLIGRGRYAGMVIIGRVKNDGLDRFRDAAIAKVRAMSQAAQRRLSRLQVNVASYILEGDRGRDSLYQYLELVTNTKDATLNREWTAEDVAGVL
jgi:hypothetical protein